MSNLRKACFIFYLCAKNYHNRSKFDKVLTKNKCLQFFWDTVYNSACRGKAPHPHWGSTPGSSWGMSIPKLSDLNLNLFTLALPVLGLIWYRPPPCPQYWLNSPNCRHLCNGRTRNLQMHTYFIKGAGRAGPGFNFGGPKMWQDGLGQAW